MAPPSVKRALALCLLASAALSSPAFAAEEAQLSAAGVEEQLVNAEQASALQQEEASLGVTPSGFGNTAKIATLGASIAALLAAVGAFFALRSKGAGGLGALKPEEYHEKVMDALMKKTFEVTFSVNDIKVSLKMPETETFIKLIDNVKPEESDKLKAGLTSVLKSKLDVAGLKEGAPVTIPLDTPVGAVNLVVEALPTKPAPAKDEKKEKQADQKKAE
ncbi:hypothetical protein Emed_004639 [Eimeria media]